MEGVRNYSPLIGATVWNLKVINLLFWNNAPRGLILLFLSLQLLMIFAQKKKLGKPHFLRHHKAKLS